ncbi:MAG: calcium/sodium antiporter [Cyclobacteriaceae bacterium]|nr:calcium/sodium antiporter [Cyclobacteriaceae bacterium]
MWLLLYTLALFTSFYLIAQVSDRYFVISLDKIAHKFNMSHDMAGATLMAIGSSAPELFVAIIALLREGGHEEIGVGTIVGSALFNLLVIIGASVIVKDAKLQWQPILRDLLFYSIAIFALYFVFVDSIITVYESLVLILLYGSYLLAVVYWRRIFKFDPGEDFEEEEEEEEKTGWRAIFIPLDFILEKLFPPKKYYMMTFTFSIIFIAVLCWVLVESAIGVSHILGIPEVVIALVVLAAGTSIPDMISSIIVAKQGRGGMAMSNAIGSNIFDIFIGLGLPWFFMSYMKNADIEVENFGLNESIGLLFGSVVLIFIILIFNKWQMKKPVGYLLVGSYGVYILYQIFIAVF